MLRLPYALPRRAPRASFGYAGDGTGSRDTRLRTHIATCTGGVSLARGDGSSSSTSQVCEEGVWQYQAL